MDGKDRPESRFFHEDCALINVAEQFKVVTERGFHCKIGQTFTSALNLGWEAVRQLRTFHTRYNDTMLLPCEDGTLILFSHLYPTTGMLLAIRIHDTETRVAEAMRRAQHEVLSFPIFPQQDQPKPEATPLDMQMEELYFYLNRILAPSQNLSFWTHCLRIANFAGCKLDFVDLPIENVILPHEDYQRLTAFLLCVFMTLRKRTGRVRLMDKDKVDPAIKNVEKVQEDDCQQESSQTLSLRLVHLSNVPLTERSGFTSDILSIESLNREFSFLNLPVFENFSFFAKNRALVFEAVFRKTSNTLSATTFANTYCILRFEFGNTME